jgi:CheY-like chemotaxis protein
VRGLVKAKQKKIIIAHDLLHLLEGQGGFLNREDVKVFTADTYEDLLKVHAKERANVIILPLEMPGVRIEKFFAVLREHEILRDASAIIICKDTLDQRERCKKCKANAVFTIPVDTVLLHLKVQQFINVVPRKSYCAAVAVGIQGSFKTKPQLFWTENISTGGILVRSEERLEKGEGIFVSFFLPNGTHVSGYGEITRIAPDKSHPGMRLYGIRFTSISPADVAAIEAFINK